MSNPEPINKPLVGIIGLVCLVAAGVCFIWYREQTSALSAFLRIGVVMTALFLALPKAGQNVRWERLVPIIAGSIILITLSKRMILVALPAILVVGILLSILRPRPKQRPPRGK
jgi:hypothetical protein